MEKRSVKRSVSPIRDPKDASSGRLDVADGNIMRSLEAMAKAVQAPRGTEYQSRHLGSSSLDRNDVWPMDISNYPSPYRSMRMKGRLLPFNLEDSAGFRLYQRYLENFYLRHKNPENVSIADAALKCLEEEDKLRLSWLAYKADVLRNDASLSNDIYECMLELVQNGGESEAPFVIDAAACIAKEASLIVNLLRQGCQVPYSRYALSQDIRWWALKVAMFHGKWSPDIAAVLLGIIKEAEYQLENMRCGNLDAIDTSNKIRRFAIEFLCYKFDEIEESDEMTSNVDGEVNQPTWGLTGEFEKNRLDKRCDNMDTQPKDQKTPIDIFSLLEKEYLKRKSIIAICNRASWDQR